MNEDVHADCRDERVWLEDVIRELKAQLARAEAELAAARAGGGVGGGHPDDTPTVRGVNEDVKRVWREAQLEGR
jgi:hypothetical protein